MSLDMKPKIMAAGTFLRSLTIKKMAYILIVLFPVISISSCQGKEPHSRSEYPITKAGEQSPASTSESDQFQNPTLSPTATLTPIPTSPPTIYREEIKKIEKMTITVVFDNYPYRKGLTTEWGFSAYVTYKDHNVLFDTGLDGSILLSNLSKLGIQPGEIQHLVLSHEHSDHTGGLAALLPKTSNLKVYVLPSFPAYLKGQIAQRAEIIEVVPMYPITERISTTGEISGYPNEQSLVIDTQDGLVVVAGCSHPGIDKIVLAAKRQFKEDIYLVMGGFHLSGAPNSDIQAVIKEFKRIDVKKVAPSHCTGDNAIGLFRKAFGDDFIRIGAGAEIEIEIIEN
jgi:7,8-dihydropterin-6-yl-methyl-4-(beta-D-ribofuranosyl)aminobenzene 5'-phosphate synthase